MCKRAAVVYCIFTLLMVTTIFRLYYVEASDYTSMATASQGEYALDISETRGVIYDRNFNRLVNRENEYIASVLPTPQAATALLEVTSEEQRPAIVNLLSSAKPFATRVEDPNIYADGIDVFKVPVRYSLNQLAPHLIGYLGGDMRSGVAGIEKAYDSWLTKTGGGISVLYQVDAAGRVMRDNTSGVLRENVDATGGVVLTLDRDIQSIAQTALSAGCEKGAAVVMDISTGDILAMASIPFFDQNHIADSLDRMDAPFINRAISGYNIGSVFKIITSAAALENNTSPSESYTCMGYIDVNGQIFRCNNDRVHGEVDMERALEVSCNTYFINLSQQIGYEPLLSICRNLGLGSMSELAPEMFTQPGNLPSTAELQNPAALANFGFGQGSSLATPLQMARVVAAIANQGLLATPRIVKGLTEDGETISDPIPTYIPNQILNPQKADQLKNMMIAVIQEGSGKPAKPLIGGAGGKTSSAQTGQMIQGEDGEKELVHAWFAGFFPAEAPKYSVVIFIEGGESGELVGAPIFKQIADSVNKLENRR